MTAFDQKLFRNALGMFATGITIVTTTTTTGDPIGMTVNSFASVSLDPPLVLWSVGQHANSFDIFTQTTHFAIHVLRQDQESLSNRFASRGEDKFGDLAWQPGEYGSPILPEYAVCFQCQTEHAYPGGDHTILVGRVMNFDDRGDQEALLYFRGGYRYL